MRTRKSTPARKASGENIEEWQRHGSKIQYRVGDEASEALGLAAERCHMTPNAYAKWALLYHLGLSDPDDDGEEREDRAAVRGNRSALEDEVAAKVGERR